MKKRQTKLSEYADLDDREEPMTVKRPRSSMSGSPGPSLVPPETTPLTLVDPNDNDMDSETWDNRTECSGSPIRNLAHVTCMLHA